METDACYEGIGAVLMQHRRPLAFLSQSLGQKNLGLSIYEKELLALVTAVTKWRHYLEGHHFIINTDHQSLKYLLEQRITTPLQQKWLTKLMGLSYEICYKKGKENVVADALSRIGKEEAKCAITTTVIPEWMKEVMESYLGDVWAQDLIRGILAFPGQASDYSYQNEILRHKGRVGVGKGGEIRKTLITALHDSQLGGLSDIQASWMRAKQLFFWPGMFKEIKTAILQCDTYRKCKDERVAYPSLLQSLYTPQHSWSHVTMDFIKGLPKS